MYYFYIAEGQVKEILTLYVLLSGLRTRKSKVMRWVNKIYLDFLADISVLRSTKVFFEMMSGPINETRRPITIQNF